MKNVLFLQARLNSKRLPSKVLLKIKGKTILEHIVNRLKQSKKIDDIFILTSKSKKDNMIFDLCNKIKINCYRGPENDVLKRFYEVAVNLNVEYIVRCNADCPFIDYKILDEMIVKFEKYRKINYLSNILQQTFPIGMHIEIFTKNTLVLAQKFCKSKNRREHVTPYIYNNKKFKIKNFSSLKNLSYHRWTIDYKEDYLFAKKIYNTLYNDKKYFDMYDILKLLSKKPELMKINYHIEKTNNLIR